MTRDLLSVSIVIFSIVLPLVMCGIIKDDQKGLEDKIEEMDQLMKTMTEDVDNAEIASGRNIAAAKKSAAKYEKRGHGETGAQNDIEEKVDAMNQLMKAVIEEVPLAKNARERNIEAAKKSAEEDAPLKKGLVQTVVENDIEDKIDEMNQLMKAVNDEFPPAKNAPGRNIAAAKKSAKEIAAVKKASEKDGKHAW